MSGDDGRSPDDDGTDAVSDADGDAPGGDDADAPKERTIPDDTTPSTDRNGPADGGDDGSVEASDAPDGGDAPAAASTPTPTAGTVAARADGDPDDRVDATLRGAWVFLREVTISVAAVVAIGLLLFAVSGVWPPMVAVESGSMEPHMYRGDLVVISEPGRYVPDAAYEKTGVVTLERGQEVGYRTFGDYGSVVVYRPNNATGGSPVIHRAHFFVTEGENWYDEANPEYHNADSCSSLPNCPAPNAGFITKGDHNGEYDQALGISDPVNPGWIVGVAHVRIPYLGHIRLWLSGSIASGRAVAGAEDRRTADASKLRGGVTYATAPPMTASAGGRTTAAGAVAPVRSDGGTPVRSGSAATPTA